MRVTDTTKGKYYATELVVTLGDGRTVSIDLSSSDPEPSYIEKRENAGIEDAYCDGHYEREATRIVADLILALDEEGKKCPTCGGTDRDGGTVATEGPDEFGNYDTDDCPDEWHA